MNEPEVKKFFSALRMITDAVMMDVEKLHPKCGEEFCNLCNSIKALYDDIRVPAQGLELAICNHLDWVYEPMLPTDIRPMMKALEAFTEEGAETNYPHMMTLKPEDFKVDVIVENVPNKKGEHENQNQSDETKRPKS